MVEDRIVSKTVCQLRMANAEGQGTLWGGAYRRKCGCRNVPRQCLPIRSSSGWVNNKAGPCRSMGQSEAIQDGFEPTRKKTTVLVSPASHSNGGSDMMRL